MPKHGIADRPKSPDDIWPDDLRLNFDNTAEQEAIQREIEVQNAVIQTPETLERLRDELAQIANAALRQAEIAEQEAAVAQKDARVSKIISILSLALSFGSLAVSVLTFIFK